jgi:site-specific DNA-cytosine methylase
MVKNITATKHKGEFERMIKELKKIGYSCKMKVVNTAFMGLPHSRPRLYMVACFGEWKPGNKILHDLATSRIFHVTSNPMTKSLQGAPPKVMSAGLQRKLWKFGKSTTGGNRTCAIVFPEAPFQVPDEDRIQVPVVQDPQEARQ